MADALISPAVGAMMWAVSSGTIAWCANRVKAVGDDQLIPMMGVLGAFIFTAQMINFSVPGTGSSGHLGGGMVLAIMLGPQAAFLVIASVLTVQSLFFADGGLLALGCNIFNLGFFPAFVAYPFIYSPIARGHQGGRVWVGAILAAIAGLQMGAFAVVLETQASAISSLPFAAFVMLMQPIHLAIGVFEGLITAAIISFLCMTRPEALSNMDRFPARPQGLRPVIIGFLLAAMLTGGSLSWFSSKRPDGLEWAISKLTGSGELDHANDTAHQWTARAREQTAILPNYGFRKSEAGATSAPLAGTSLSGILGGVVTFAFCVLLGFLLKLRKSGT